MVLAAFASVATLVLNVISCSRATSRILLTLVRSALS